MKAWNVAAIAGLFLCLTPIVNANIVVDTVDALQDTYIDELAPSNVRGAEPRIILYNEDGPIYYILIQYDIVTILADKPDSFEFVNARMGLYAYYSGGEGTVDVYNVTEPWNEDSACFDNKPEMDISEWATGDLPDTADEWLSVDVTVLMDSVFGDIIQPEEHLGFYVYAHGPHTWEFHSKECDTCCAFMANGELTPKLFVTWSTTTGAEEAPVEDVSLSASPVSRALALDYYLPAGRTGSLKVYDASGAVVSTLEARPGVNSVAVDVLPGVYFVRFTSGSYEIVRKVAVVR